MAKTQKKVTPKLPPATADKPAAPIIVRAAYRPLPKFRSPCPNC
jgi:hypothetical protein